MLTENLLNAFYRPRPFESSFKRILFEIFNRVKTLWTAPSVQRPFEGLSLTEEIVIGLTLKILRLPKEGRPSRDRITSETYWHMEFILMKVFRWPKTLKVHFRSKKFWRPCMPYVRSSLMTEGFSIGIWFYENLFEDFFQPSMGGDPFLRSSELICPFLWLLWL